MNVEPAPIPILSGLAEIAASRKAWFCDVWGVLHDGLTAFPSAVEACRAFMRRGGEIILVSNSPRISAPVLDASACHWRAGGLLCLVVTSGDVTRGFVEAYPPSRCSILGRSATPACSKG